MEDKMQKIISLCKRRGFVFPGSEIYGGLANTWDFGPLGVELARNIKNLWWKRFVSDREDVVGIASSILMNPKVWEASGHVEGFSDPLVECKKCKKRFREDLLSHSISEYMPKKQLGGGISEAEKIKIAKMATDVYCPSCGSKDFTKPKNFNLMFKTFIGPVEDDASVVHLRPETAQGMFVNFENVQRTTRKKLPFGIAQIGKAFRNEITPRNFIFRVLEFEQMEIEYFCEEKDWEKYFDMWQKDMEQWLEDIGISKKNYAIREHEKEELSHYSKKTIDFEYKYPFGQKELYGLAYRTDFDLKAHKLKYEDMTPHVIEPSMGLERTILAVLCDAYTEEKVKNDTRVVLKLDKKIAPIKVAVFPLLRNKPELVKKAREVFEMLKPHFTCEFDDNGNIGKRYRRQDELGTIFCLTCDHQTLEDNTLTLRDRDTMKQERIKIDELKGLIEEKLN